MDVSELNYSEHAGLPGTPSRFAFYQNFQNERFATGRITQPNFPGPCRAVWKFNDDTSIAPGWPVPSCYSGASNEEGIAVTADSSTLPGDLRVYSAGFVETTAGRHIVISAFLASTGAFSWERVYTGENYDVPVRMFVDEGGGGGPPTGDPDRVLYVAGSSKADGQGLDFVLFKLDAATGISLWGEDPFAGPIPARYNGPGSGDDTAVDLAVSPRSLNGEWAYVFGSSDGGSATGLDYAIFAVRKDNPLVTRVGRWNGGKNDYASAMTIRAVFNQPDTLFVTGYTANLVNGSFDYATTSFVQGTGPADLVLNPSWATPSAIRTYGFLATADGHDLARCIALTGNHRVVVTGESWGGLATGYDIATTEYAEFNGEPIVAWNPPVRFDNNFNGSSQDDRPSDLLTDKCGNVYIGGTTFNLVSPGVGSLDLFAVSYWESAGRRWLEGMHGTPPPRREYVTKNGTAGGPDIGAALAVRYEGGVDHDGDVYLFGVVDAALTGTHAPKYGLVRYVQHDMTPAEACGD